MADSLSGCTDYKALESQDDDGGAVLSLRNEHVFAETIALSE